MVQQLFTLSITHINAYMTLVGAQLRGRSSLGHMDLETRRRVCESVDSTLFGINTERARIPLDHVTQDIVLGRVVLPV